MTEIVNSLRGLESLRELSADELAPLADVTRQQRYAAGEVIHHQGEPRTRVIAIQEGQVRISRELGNLGRERLAHGLGHGVAAFGVVEGQRDDVSVTLQKNEGLGHGA